MPKPANRWEPGRHVGSRYRIERFLDEGSAAEVYAAQNVWTGRNVALKRLHPQHMTKPAVVERFMLEGRIGGRIDHPNVVQTLDMAQEPDDESFFIVQELLRGESLRQVLGSGGALDFRDALDLVVPLLGALVAVHQQGIVHRDIKPENIILADSTLGHRVPKLLDFGVAKVRRNPMLTRAGSLIGTVEYMAPEQVEGRKDVDRRVDVWAMGIVVYELITGECPFEATTAAETISNIITRDPPVLEKLVSGIPVAISAAVHRAMRKDRQQRYDSVQQFLEELLRWSLGSSDEFDRALVSRHRTSLPNAVEQRVRAGGSMTPLSIRPSAFPSLRFAPISVSERLRALADRSDQEAPASEPPVSYRDREPPTLRNVRTIEPPPGFKSAPPGQMLFEGDSPTDDAQWGTDELIASAYSSLRKHAFVDAHNSAGRAYARLAREGECEPKRSARLLLVQAEAAYWLGRYERHQNCTLQALSLVAPPERTWFLCAAELAEASNKLGNHEQLSDIARNLAQFSHSPEVGPDYVVACCRSGIALQRAGWREQVEAVLGLLTSEMYALEDRHPIVRAWLCLLRSELADHAGDYAHSLKLTEQAVSAFQQGGDERRACLYRGDIGNATMLLGDYEKAERLLRASLEEAAAIQIAGATTMRMNLGITLARLGRVQDGHECLLEALPAYIDREDRGGECAARIYLAEVLWIKGEWEAAQNEARIAVGRAPSPVVLAEALGTLSLVQRQRPMESFISASQAMELLQAAGGAAEGEARIRLAYALALNALGHHGPAADAAADARNRLLERSSRISDEGWRKRFLENVVDHARTLRLAQTGAIEG